MKTILKFIQKRKILSFILGAILCGLLLVPTSTYANLIVNSIISQIDSAKVYVAVKEPSFTFIGLYQEEITVRPAKSPVGITLSEVRITPLFSDLFRGALTLKVSGKWLGGNALLHWRPLADEVSIKVVGAAIHSLPMLQFVGVTAGQLSSEVVGLHFQKNGKVDRVRGFKVEVSGIEKPLSSKIPKGLLPLPAPIEIPPLNNTSLELSGSADSEKVQLDSSKFKSSIGKLSGTVNFVHKRPQTIDLQMDGLVTESGMPLFKDMLSLFSRGKVKQANQPFTITATGRVKPIPNIKISPVEHSPTPSTETPQEEPQSQEGQYLLVVHPGQ